MLFAQVRRSAARIATSRGGGRFGVALVAWLMLSAAAPLWAQLPHARLHWIYPSGGQRGTSVDVTTYGVDLDAPSALVFSHPGITAATKSAPPRVFENEPRPLPGQFRVSIAADVAPGIYECRVLGRYGLSTPRAFSVGSLREVLEEGNNNTFETPMPLELNSVVNGRSDSDGYDVYQFTAVAGQRVLIGCEALRIDSRMDATLVLLDESGNRLAYSRDARRNEPMIDFTVPVDGKYWVQVYDFTYQGGDEFFYRLSVSTQPHLDFIFPPAGVPGSTGRFTLYGRNLPGAKPADGVTIAGATLDQLKVEIAVPADPQGPGVPLSGSFVAPTDAETRGFEYRLESAEGASNAVFIAFATADVLPEQAPNDDREQPQQVVVPCEIVGQFYPRRDRDWFSFEAKQGERFAIEVFSQRWGLPTDPDLLVQHVSLDEQGEEQVRDIQESDDLDPQFANPPFDTPLRDAALAFTADADGTYRVLVRDLYVGSNPDPRHVYCLSIGPPQPDFQLLTTLKAFDEPDPNKVLAAAPILRPGGTALAVVQIYRRAGFDGPVTLAATGLPEGVVCRPVVLAANQNRATLVFAAAEDAAPWSGAINVIGTAEIDGEEVRRESLGSYAVWDQNGPAEPTHARLTGDVMLSVIDEGEPLAVTLAGQETWETSRAGKLSIPVQVARRGEVKGAVKLEAQGLPKEITATALNLDEQTNEAQLELTIDPNAPTGPLSFYLAGQAKVVYQRNPEAAQSAEEEKVEFADLVARLAEESRAAEAAKVDATEEDKMRTTEVAKALAEKLAAAKEEQKVVEKRAAELATASQPKEIDLVAHSLPVTLHVSEAPIMVSSPLPAAAIPLGGESQIAVRVERRHGFDDVVDLKAELPKDVTGIHVEPTQVAADQPAANLVVKVAADATPGTHQATLRASLTYNGQSLLIERPLEVRVEAGEQVAQK